MKTKFTPGPWSRDKYGRVIGPDGQSVGFGALTLRMSNDDEVLANDCLVAAAPELFEALRLMISEDFPSLPLAVQALRLELADAALLKATGQAT